MTPRKLFIDALDTPLGELFILADSDGRLCDLGWGEGSRGMQQQLESRRTSSELTPESNPGGLTSALRDYFGGQLSAIDRLPVALEGTDFQRRVWTALREIPCGQTWSYLQLAQHIGNAKAVRAVGLANGANPVAVVVPCHRVIGADGSLTGYGGGLHRKRWLLAHERAGAPQLELGFKP